MQSPLIKSASQSKKTKQKSQTKWKLKWDLRRIIWRRDDSESYINRSISIKLQIGFVRGGVSSNFKSGWLHCE